MNTAQELHAILSDILTPEGVEVKLVTGMDSFISKYHGSNEKIFTLGPGLVAVSRIHNTGYNTRGPRFETDLMSFFAEWKMEHLVKAVLVQWKLLRDGNYSRVGADVVKREIGIIDPDFLVCERDNILFARAYMFMVLKDKE